MPITLYAISKTHCLNYVSCISGLGWGSRMDYELFLKNIKRKNLAEAVNGGRKWL